MHTISRSHIRMELISDPLLGKFNYSFLFYEKMKTAEEEKIRMNLAGHFSFHACQTFMLLVYAHGSWFRLCPHFFHGGFGHSLRRPTGDARHTKQWATRLLELPPGWCGKTRLACVHSSLEDETFIMSLSSTNYWVLRLKYFWKTSILRFGLKYTLDFSS